MKFIIGKKVGMTQLFEADGVVKPVTIVEAGPCQVVEVKGKDTHGYTALQVAFGVAKKSNKPRAGHTKDLTANRFLKEFHIDKADAIKRGDTITVDTFAAGDVVKVTGVTKGRGFQGVVKRHGFGGHPVTHGHKDQLRMPGSSGAQAPQRVFPGVKKPGRMGGDQHTTVNLEIVKVDNELNRLYILGAVPGPISGILYISGTGELKIAENMSKNTQQTIDTSDLKDNNTPVVKEESQVLSEENSEKSVSQEVVSDEMSEKTDNSTVA